MGLYELAKDIKSEKAKAKSRLAAKIASMAQSITLTEILEAIENRNGFPPEPRSNDPYDSINCFIDVEHEQRKSNREVEVYSGEYLDKLRGREGFIGYKITITKDTLTVSGLINLTFKDDPAITQVYAKKQGEWKRIYNTFAKNDKISQEILDQPITI